MEPLLIVAMVVFRAVIKWLAIVAAVVVGVRIAERLPRRTT